MPKSPTKSFVTFRRGASMFRQGAIAPSSPPLVPPLGLRFGTRSAKQQFRFKLLGTSLEDCFSIGCLVSNQNTSLYGGDYRFYQPIKIHIQSKLNGSASTLTKHEASCCWFTGGSFTWIQKLENSCNESKTIGSLTVVANGSNIDDPTLTRHLSLDQCWII